MDFGLSIDAVLLGVRGLVGLFFYLGMLYFGFILMRVHPGRWECVFFWAVIGQLTGLCLVAVVSVAMFLVGHTFMDAGGVNWIWVASSIFKGLVLLSALLGAVALLASTLRGGVAPKAG